MTRDISALGAYVFSAARPPLNAVLQVEILLPRPSGSGAALIKGEMVVLRVDGETGERGESGFAGEASHLSFPAGAPCRKRVSGVSVSELALKKECG
jgi:hypothetical protein